MLLLQWQIDEYTTRKAAIEVELASLDQVIAAYIANPVGSYTINTGQTTQQVTKANIQQFLDLRDRLRAERWDLLTALNGGLGRSAYFRPDF